MKLDFYEYHVAEHFASAIINGDHSGLDDTEEAALNEFMADLPNVSGHWTIDGADSECFTRCDVTGLHAMCVTACLHFRT